MRKFMLLSTLLLAVSAAGSNTPTTDHVVSADELRGAIRSAAEQREADQATLRSFFGKEGARKALKVAGIDHQQLDRAVAQISDSEAAELAARVRQAESDFAAGALTNQQITYILIALAAAVIVLILA